jgi:transmembrane sensor
MSAEPIPTPATVRLAPMDWAGQAGKEEVLVLEIRRRLKERRTKRKRLVVAAGSVVALVGVLSYVIPLERSTSDVRTVAGKRSELSLKDGSHVDLNARTVLHTDFRFGRRIVTLSEGEAFFSVAKDKAHPFLVRTPQGAVEVTGTQFDVKVDPTDATVTLVAGAVTLKEHEASVGRLSPGEQALLDGHPPQIRALSGIDVEKVTAWRQGKLILAGLNLSQAAAQMALYHGCEIHVAKEVGEIALDGTCPLDDLQGFLNSLTQAFPVQVHSVQDTSYSIEPK